MKKFVLATLLPEDSNTINKAIFDEMLSSTFSDELKEVTVLDLNLADKSVVEKFIDMGGIDCFAFSPETLKNDFGKKIVSRVINADKLLNVNTQFLNIYDGGNKENVDISVALGNLMLENEYKCNIMHFNMDDDPRISTQNLIGIRNSAIKSRSKLQQKNNDIFEFSTSVIDNMESEKSEYTARHMLSVSMISRAIAKKLGLSEKEIEILKVGALLHDIGKKDIDDEILNKPSRLSEEEFQKMKQHVTLGEIELDQFDLGEYEKAKIIAAEHHERYDGTGYPRGLKGDQIDLYSRIVSIADATQAMFGRSYAARKNKN